MTEGVLLGAAPDIVNSGVGESHRVEVVHHLASVG